MKGSTTPPGSPASLLLRRARIPKTLPPLEEVLRSSFLQREIRCGKPGCRCASGPGHPTLYLSVTFAGGRTQQVTVPRELARTGQLWIRNYGRWWQAIEAVSAINRRLLRLREIPRVARARRSGGSRHRARRSA